MVYEKSEMMRNRAQSRDRDIRAIVKEIESKGKLGDLQEVYFWTVSTADLAVTLPSWIAAYEKGMENFGMDEAKAIDYADMIIRNTQDAGSPKDLSRIQRGGELMKLFTMFYNSLNTAFNMMAEEVLRAKLGKGSKKQIAAAFFWLVFLPAVAGELMFGDDEDDEDSDGTWNTIARYAKAVAQYPLTTIPLLRDVVSSYQYRTTPAQAMFEEGRRAFKAVGFAVDAFKSGDGDKEREALRRLTTGSLMVAGYAFKFPAGQLRITLNALFDAFDDDYDVEPLDFFLYRKRKKVKK